MEKNKYGNITIDSCKATKIPDCYVALGWTLMQGAQCMAVHVEKPENTELSQVLRKKAGIDFIGCHALVGRTATK